MTKTSGFLEGQFDQGAGGVQALDFGETGLEEGCQDAAVEVGAVGGAGQGCEVDGAGDDGLRTLLAG